MATTVVALRSTVPMLSPCCCIPSKLEASRGDEVPAASHTLLRASATLEQRKQLSLTAGPRNDKQMSSTDVEQSTPPSATGSDATIRVKNLPNSAAQVVCLNLLVRLVHICTLFIIAERKWRTVESSVEASDEKSSTNCTS